MDVLGVGIIGAGYMGVKRAAAIVASGRGVLLAVADTDYGRASVLAQGHRAEAYGDWRELLSRNDISIVIVAVPNACAAPIVIASLAAGKHVLCEKPFGITTDESSSMIAAAQRAGRLVKVGFNHRFHASVQKARELCAQGAIGTIMLVRARYGYGGRPGMEKEWRLQKSLSGGGELLDQGVHVIDLARWFCGEFTHVYGLLQTKFWPTELDDNAFGIFRNERATVSMHVSTTNWKNLFSFEIFGTAGYLQIDGKGGSYGDETLIYGRSRPGAAPHCETFSFGSRDVSWEGEWIHFHDRVSSGAGELCGDALDGLRANEIVEAMRRSSDSRLEIELPRSG